MSMVLEVGKVYPVTCTKILEKGVVVQLEDGTTEFIHISNLSTKYVRYIEDYVTVGQSYQAVGIVGRVRPTELALQTNDKGAEDRGQAEKPHVTATHQEKREPTTVAYVPYVNVPNQNPRKQKSAPKTDLDYMIEQSNAAYKEKTARKKKGNGRRGRDSRWN